MDCEGNCKIHSGEIVTVGIVDPDTGYNWGFFDYCEVALLEDCLRGFTIIEVKEGE